MRMLTILPLAAALAACTAAAPRPSQTIVKSQLAPVTEAISPTEGDSWTLVWSDEFDGSEINQESWGFDVDCWGGGNNERQCYTDHPNNASVRDGRLVITARKERKTGAAFPPHLRKTPAERAAKATKPFTSARLTTRQKHSWKYGWIEVRAKLPQGQGTWPAIWMLPEGNSYGPWAASGEIDILEAVNLGVDCAECPGGKENTILGTLHFGGPWPDNSFHSNEAHLPGELDGYHTYAIIWDADKMTWLVDGRVFAEATAETWYSTNSDAKTAPFDQEFHLILNLAIGGGLAEGRGLGGVSSTGFPKHMEVDWVRVWQRSERSPNGRSVAQGDEE